MKVLLPKYKFFFFFFFLQVGESILRVSANDPDDVTEHALKYKIVSGNTHVFTVNERNGWVKINGSLDREQQASYRLKIMASDVDDNSAIATVDVRLIDINDCPPVFNRTTFTLHVKEDELVQQVRLREFFYYSTGIKCCKSF